MQIERGRSAATQDPAAGVDDARRALDEKLRRQENEYRRELPRLRHAAEALGSALKGALEMQEINDHQVIAVVKPWDSIPDKIEDGRARRWNRCSDLLRARVTVPSTDLVDRVLHAISRYRRPGSLSNRFWFSSEGRSRGHAGMHLQVDLPDSVDVQKVIQRTGAELQVMTRLQATWDTITHDSLYKPRAGVPMSVRHRAHRLAAAIDLLDHEIQEIRADLPALRHDAREQVLSLIKGEKWSEIELDEISLELTTTGAPLREPFELLRDLGYEAGFKRSAWRDLVRVGLETDVFLAFAEQVDVHVVSELFPYINRSRDWLPALQQLSEHLDGGGGSATVLFDRPLFVLTVVMALTHPGAPGPRLLPEVLAPLRAVRASFPDNFTSDGHRGRKVSEDLSKGGSV